LLSPTECPPPGPGNLSNGVVVGDGSVYRSTYYFACNDGYVLDGHAIVSCTENGTWNGTTPSCLKGNILDLFFLSHALLGSTVSDEITSDRLPFKPRRFGENRGYVCMREGGR